MEPLAAATLERTQGFEELTWDLLLHLIDQGEVLPIVGQDLLTWPEEEGAPSLYVRLANQIAQTLGVSAHDLPEEGALNEVAYRFVRAGGNRLHLYPALWRAMAFLNTLPVPGALERLASISAFKLFLSTTFDPLLVRALEKARPYDEKRVFSYTPKDPRRDIPEDWASRPGFTVYHLLGRVQAVPDYAVTEEDILEFVHALQSETRRPKNLFAALHGKHLLILGCSFPDWLARFFLRVGTAEIEAPRAAFVADRVVNRDPALREFLRHYSNKPWIFEGSQATEFVAELARRWLAHQQPTAISPEFIFLSYAREDLKIALAVREALRAARLESFLDLEEVQPGEAWENRIKWAIQKCRLFVPILSANVFIAKARYFRFEWDQALHQRVLRPWELPFIVPLASEEVSTDDSRLPEQFRKNQWLRIQDNTLSSEGLKRLEELMRRLPS